MIVRSDEILSRSIHPEYALCFQQSSKDMENGEHEHVKWMEYFIGPARSNNRVFSELEGGYTQREMKILISIVIFQGTILHVDQGEKFWTYNNF